MSSLQLLIAIGEADIDRVETIAESFSKLLGEREGDVVLSHVLTPTEYDRALETLSERVDQSDRTLSTGRPETASLHVSTSGERGLTSELERDQSQLSPSDAARRILGQKTLIRETVAALEDVGLTVEVRGAIGDPAEEVDVMMEEMRPDFVIVGGRDRHPAKQAMFGSISQQIISSANCPVVSVRET